MQRGYTPFAAATENTMQCAHRANNHAILSNRMRGIGKQVPCHISARGFQAPVCLLPVNRRDAVVQITMDQVNRTVNMLMRQKRPRELGSVGHNNAAKGQYRCLVLMGLPSR